MNKSDFFCGAEYNGRLILGESAYQSKASEQWTPDYRKRFMENWIKQPRTLDDDKYFEGRVTCMLANRSPMELDKANAWKGCATENYINDLIKPLGGDFTPQNWDSAARRFPELIGLLEPTHIVVCGTGLTNEIRNRFRRHVTLSMTFQMGGYDHPVYSLELSRRKLLFLEMQHPGRRPNVRKKWGVRDYDWRFWHPVVQHFFSTPVR